jgi:hypothetical protein
MFGEGQLGGREGAGHSTARGAGAGFQGSQGSRAPGSDLSEKVSCLVLDELQERVSTINLARDCYSAVCSLCSSCPARRRGGAEAHGTERTERATEGPSGSRLGLDSRNCKCKCIYMWISTEVARGRMRPPSFEQVGAVFVCTALLVACLDGVR